MARTKKNAELVETKPVETKQKRTKTVKAEPKQNEPKPNIVSAEAVQKEPKQTKNVKPETVQALKDLVALHPTATASVLKAFTTDAEVKQLLDEFIERGCGDSPIEVY